MSFRAVDAVLKATIRPPALKLVAVVMAHALNHKTGQLNIGHQAIADTVGLDKRNAQRYVKELRDLGVLSVVRNALGGAPGSTPFYRMHLDRLAELTQQRPQGEETDGTDADPTDGASAAPAAANDAPRDGAGIQDGRRGHPRGTALASQTVGAGAVQTGLNRKEPEGNRDCAQGSLAGIETLPADAGRTDGLRVKSSAKKRGEPAPTNAVWEAYSGAYCERYGVPPVRNGKVNGLLGQLLTRIAADEAPEVAAFYVRHQLPFYVSKVHAVEFLLKDAESLRTQWKTGRAVEPQPMRGAVVGRQTALEQSNARAGEQWLREEAQRGRQESGARAARSSRASAFDAIDYSEGVPLRG